MISVIVPAYNAERTIGACLQSLEHQSFPRDQYEVIVVDDGSSDSTSGVASGYQASVIKQPRRGPGAARNYGASVARGDALLFTDADCVPAPDWIARMLEAFSESDVVGVKGAYGTHQRGLVARFAQQEFEDKYDWVRAAPRIDIVDTYSAAYRRDIFQKAGGFDERLRQAEDVELSYRLAIQGHRMIFQPAALVYHLHPESLASYALKKFKFGVWRSRAYRRFPRKTLRDSTTPRVLLVQMPLAAALLTSALATVMWSQAIAIFAAAAVAFAASSIPFVRKAWGRDRAAAAMSPLILPTRAFALGVGLAAGILSQVWAKG